MCVFCDIDLSKIQLRRAVASQLKTILISHPKLLAPSAFLKLRKFCKTRRLLPLYLHPDKSVTNEKAAASAFIRAQEALKIIKGATNSDLLVPALVESKRRLKKDDAFAAMAFTATKVVKHEKPTTMASAVLYSIVVAPINDEEGDRTHQPGGSCYRRLLSGCLLLHPPRRTDAPFVNADVELTFNHSPLIILNRCDHRI